MKNPIILSLFSVFFLLSYVTLGYEKYLLCLAYIYFRNLYNPNEGTELLAGLDDKKSMRDVLVGVVAKHTELATNDFEFNF